MYTREEAEQITELLSELACLIEKREKVVNFLTGQGGEGLMMSEYVVGLLYHFRIARPNFEIDGPELNQELPNFEELLADIKNECVLYKLGNAAADVMPSEPPMLVLGQLVRLVLPDRCLETFLVLAKDWSGSLTELVQATLELGPEEPEVLG